MKDTWHTVLLLFRSLYCWKRSLLQKNRVCGCLQQPFRLLQQLQIWQAYPSTKGDASWEISFQPLPYFLRYGNLQQILIKNAAFCSNPVNWGCPAPSNMKEEVKIHHHAKFHIFCRKWSLYLHPSKLVETKVTRRWWSCLNFKKMFAHIEV